MFRRCRNSAFSDVQGRTSEKQDKEVHFLTGFDESKRTIKERTVSNFELKEHQRTIDQSRRYNMITVIHKQIGGEQFFLDISLSYDDVERSVFK